MVKFIILTCLGYLANIYLALPLQASAVYYIDFNEGSDTAEGTSPSTAWKTIPGTYNLQRTDYQSRTWGSSSVSSSKKVPAGTTFRIKSGSVHNEINGSYIVIDSAFYATNADAASPISFVRDTNWGTGSIVFDGAAMNLNATNAEALIVVKTHGIVFNGVTRRGIIIQNSGVSGLRIKDVGAAPARDIILSNLYGYNNGTSILGDNLGAGVAHFHMKSVAGGQILSCEVDGNNQFVNGFLFGETHLSATNVMVTDCSAHRLKGDLSGNDSGIGFKAQNSQITFNDCTAYNNLKGFDLGEESGDGSDIIYKVNRANVYANSWGVNFTGPARAYTGRIRFYLMNSIVRDNSYTGSNIYSGPFELFMVHNVFDNNGTPGDLYNKSSLIITPNHVTYPNQDQNPIIAYLYNNIFYKSNAETSLLNKYWRISTVPPNYSTDLTINSDYNAWIQRDNEAFCLLGAYNGSQEASTFKYGANGPGNSSGNWYEWYGGSKNVPTAGTGHYHQDSHSYASGGANPSVPSFYDISNHNYVLTAAYPGINLLSMPWYIPEMGQDSRGVNRSSWDLGPLDFNLSIISPTNLRLVGP